VPPSSAVTVLPRMTAPACRTHTACSSAGRCSSRA
jgi:hypothetical protein